MKNLTWEQAVAWLRAQPDQSDLARANYYDDPLVEAAKRFAASEEWRAVRKFLPRLPGRALDLGAGRGIACYAMAHDGWDVTAAEPDPSPLVGALAIREIARESGLPIGVVDAYGEALPFADETFDLVYERGALHHARDLLSMCKEAARVLKSGGRLVAAREHVVTTREDLAAFLAGHPLHKFYGGENAFLLSEYESAIRSAGLHILRTLGPFDSVINYSGIMTYNEWWSACCDPLARIIGLKATRLLTSKRHLIGRWLLHRLAARLSKTTQTPGRLYTFIAEKATRNAHETQKVTPTVEP